MNTPEIMLQFDPLDSLFFRDGRPYTQGESEQVGVQSQFPPTPATLVGALRAAVARSLGWAGHGAWNNVIEQQLGTGADLGPLRFRGPLLMWGGDLLFPAPANLMCAEADGTTTIALLRPGPERNCDLGAAVRLPALPEQVRGEGWKQALTAWLTADCLQAVLSGESPAAARLVKQETLWSLEARVGIARDPQTLTTKEGALYSPQHVRLQQTVSLGLWASGLPQDVLKQLAQTPHPLGGESRSAWITQAKSVPTWPAMPKTLHQLGDELHYSVLVLSPLPLAQPLVSNQPVPGLPGHLVSASLPRPLMLGGWDSLKRQPLALKPHLAPGSVLFMCAKPTDETVIRALHGTCIGERPVWGYGLVAIGTWN